MPTPVVWKKQNGFKTYQLVIPPWKIWWWERFLSLPAQEEETILVYQPHCPGSGWRELLGVQRLTDKGNNPKTHIWGFLYWLNRFYPQPQGWCSWIRAHRRVPHCKPAGDLKLLAYETWVAWFVFFFKSLLLLFNCTSSLVLSRSTLEVELTPATAASGSWARARRRFLPQGIAPGAGGRL